MSGAAIKPLEILDSHAPLSPHKNGSFTQQFERTRLQQYELPGKEPIKDVILPEAQAWYC